MKRLASAVAIVTLLGLPSAASAASTSVPLPFPAVNGSVTALLVDGDTAYVGGAFDAIGRASGPLATFSASDGAVRRTFPQIAGRAFPGTAPWPPTIPATDLRALASDGAGGWYVGGGFSRVAGRNRASLAHVLADGSLDPAFRADMLGTVEALARRGDTLYVGGSFPGGLVAVDAGSGAVRWRYAAADAVLALSLDGARLYAGGRFGAVALDAATGGEVDWPAMVSGEVDSIVGAGDRVYVGGRFSSKRYKRGIAVLDAGTAEELPIEYRAEQVTELALAGSALVVAGSFLGNAPGSVMAFDAQTGARLPWFSGVTGYARALGVDGDRLYVAGLGNGVQAFDATSGAPLAWSTGRITGPAMTVAAAGGEVALGGGLSVVDALPRGNLAAVDLRTGAVLPFDPEPYAFTGLSTPQYGQVRALAKRGDTLYIGGQFPTAGGAPAKNLAAVDVRTGAAEPMPESGTVYALALDGTTLYVAGGFSGSPYFGAVDVTTRAALPWSPKPDCAVYGLAVSASTLHVAGCFWSIGGQNRQGYAAFDTATGALSTTFTTTANSYGRAVAPDGAGGVWLGGEFTALSAGGGPYLAHLGADGRPLPGVPTPGDGRVFTLATAGSDVYVGGEFGSFAGTSRTDFAALGGDGRLRPFRTDPDSEPRALAALPDGGLLVGGESGNSALSSAHGVMRFGAAAPTQPPAALEAPRIGGDTWVGGTQRVEIGDWDGAPTAFDVRWLLCDANGDACAAQSRSGMSATMHDEAAGHRYRVEVTASNDAGATTVRSAPGPFVPGYRPEPIGRPSAWGVRRVGQVLTVDPGLWNGPPDAYRYEWWRCPPADAPCRRVGDQPEYTTVAADAGAIMRSRVTAVNSAGPSPATSANDIGPILDGTPSGVSNAGWFTTIGGTQYYEGGVLYAGEYDESSSPTHSWRFTWLSCDASGDACVRLPGHPSRLRLSTAEVGHTIRLAVVTYDENGPNTEGISAATRVIGPNPNPNPTPTPTPSPTPTPTPTATPAYTPAAAATASPEPAIEESAEPEAPIRVVEPPPAFARVLPAAASARIVRRAGVDRVVVRLRSAVAGRVTVRVRLASGARAVVGRSTVTLLADTGRDVRVSLSRRARHRKFVAEL